MLASALPFFLIFECLATIAVIFPADSSVSISTNAVTYMNKNSDDGK